MFLPVSFRNDLHVFDPVEKTWTELTESMTGTPPARRHAMGMVASGGLLYVFGGFTDGPSASEGQREGRWRSSAGVGQVAVMLAG